MMIDYILIGGLSYLIGSIPSGLILGKLLWHTDLRQHGSRNIGATNAWRTLGKIPGLLGLSIVGTPWAAVIGGLCAIVGHSFSLFLQFHGGKGVATSLGVLTMLMGKVTIVVFLLWLLVVYTTRYVSLGSILAGFFTPIFAMAFGSPMEYVLFSTVAAVLVIVRHRENIQRLMKGTENKI